MTVPPQPMPKHMLGSFSPIEQLLTRLGVEWRKGYVLCPPTPSADRRSLQPVRSANGNFSFDRAVMADPIWNSVEKAGQTVGPQRRIRIPPSPQNSSSSSASPASWRCSATAAPTTGGDEAVWV